MAKSGETYIAQDSTPHTTLFLAFELSTGDENEKGTRIVSLPLPHSESR
jgi:hypothetical protein